MRHGQDTETAGFALALCLHDGDAAGVAFAETTQYDLFVNGRQFTSDNLTIACGEGTATVRSRHAGPYAKQRIYHERG